jgi:hypothetical protein
MISAPIDPADRMGGPLLPVRHDRWALELRGDEVADVSFASVPLLRAVRPVVRDQDWNTVPVRVVSRSEQHSDGQHVVVTELLFEAPTIRYRATTTVTLTADELTVDLAGEALTDFVRNRIGLVVLHPASDAGEPVDVVTTAGSVIPGRWPLDISPHQPFADLVGFRWSKAGVDAELELSGDVFETEDQRNWTDLSFKTYSTPLALPFPVAVRVGDRVHQRARLRASGRPAGPGGRRHARHPNPGPDRIEVSDTSRATVPALALGASRGPSPVHSPAPAPGYEAVLVELVGDPAGWPARLRAADRQAAALGAGLDVRLVTAEPDVVARTVQTLPAGVLRLAAFSPVNHVSTEPLWDALVAAAGGSGFGGDLVGGTRAHFTELNRTFAELPERLPALAYSLTGQMHASEVPHLVDSITGQRVVAENAVRLAAGRPLHVGPVTLARRFNAVATSGTDDVEADPLQPTGFAAAWTLGSLDALTLDGVRSVCYFETSGPGGIADEAGSPYPVQRVLDTVAGLRGRQVLASSSPDHLVSYAVRDDAGRVDLLVGNLGPEDRTVPVRLPGAAELRLTLPRWSVVAHRHG